MGNMDSTGEGLPAKIEEGTESWRAGLAVMNAGKPLAELKGDAEPILARLRQGHKAKDIATDIGISDVALYAFLLRHCPEEWLALSAARSLSRINKAGDDLDDENADKNKISRARESARIAQWDLERASRKLYGDTKAGTGVTVQVTVDRSCGEVTIQGEQLP